jgi:hypothetical protein
MFGILERLLPKKEETDPWEGSEGKVVALLKVGLMFVAKECSRRGRTVQAKYNKETQWVELRVGNGDLLAVLTARGNSRGLECVIVTSTQLTEREKDLIKDTFAPTRVTFR